MPDRRDLPADRHADLSVHTPNDMALVQAELNLRLCKVLGRDSHNGRLATLLGSLSVLRR